MTKATAELQSDDSGVNRTRNSKVKTIPKLRLGEFGWIWVGTAILFGVSAIVAPGTVRLSSLLAMLPFAGMLAIVAIGQTVVIQQRGIDMSAAGMMSLAGILVAKFGAITDATLAAAFATLVIGAVAGAVNGLLVARLNITPIIATLALNALLVGAVRAISGGTPMNVPSSLQDFSHQQLLGVPYSVILALIFIAAVAILTKHTLFGRRFIAVGANLRTSSAAGIIVLRYQVGAYALAGLCFSVAGMLYAGFIGSASPTAGNDYLLPGIAAVVVGGTPFSGGRGSVVASGVAALFIAQLGQMVLALGATSPVQLLVQAAAIVLATALRQIPVSLLLSPVKSSKAVRTIGGAR